MPDNPWLAIDAATAPTERAQQLRAAWERFLGDGRAEAVWDDAKSGAELHTRLAGLPGFGAQKARIFVALLGKQRGVRPRGWCEAAGAYGEAGSFRSVADVTCPESLQKVREHKKEMKAAARVGA